MHYSSIIRHTDLINTGIIIITLRKTQNVRKQHIEYLCNTFYNFFSMTHDFIAVTIHVVIIIVLCTDDVIGAKVLLLKTVDRHLYI